ncbi:MAG TPA: hypothetical protein VJQ09_03545 [Candidatus Limnocylindria bacterium]|nr:hypothetical protein [Candidatus Limnocylindria bacterium]
MRMRYWEGSWTGVALIVLGLVFLAQNWFGYELRNWWALFILIPAAGSFSAALAAWRSGAAREVAGSFTTGLVLTATAAIFLLDLPWDRVWPLLVIIAGVGLLLPSLARGQRA